MKCINKVFSLILTFVLCFSLVACGSKEKDSVASYDLYDSSFIYGITHNGSSSNIELFSNGLCVAGKEDLGTSAVDSQVAQAGGAFNVNDQSVV